MKKMIFSALLFFVALVAADSVNSAPQTVTQVTLTQSGFLYNRQTDTFDMTVTIKNTGSVPWAVPIRLIIESVSPASVSLYNIYGNTPQGKPYVDAFPTNFVLNPAESVVVPVRFVNLGRAVTNVAFSVQAQQLTPLNAVQLSVLGMMDSSNGGSPVGSGFEVKLDGVTRGFTDSSGHATFFAPVDSSIVSVMSPPNYVGTATLAGLSLFPGQSQNVTVQVSDSGEFGADGVLRIDRLQHLMLPSIVPSIVLRFFHYEKPVASDLIESVELREPSGSATPTDVTSYFTIRPDGSLSASTTQFLTAVGNGPAKKLLFAQIVDKDGISYQSQIPFYISKYTVQGKLVAPPSNPSLPVAGIPVQVTVLNTDIAFATETTADGSFPLPLLPSGNLSIQASISSSGLTYVGQGVAVIGGNTLVNIVLRGPADIANNIPPITTGPL